MLSAIASETYFICSNMTPEHSLRLNQPLLLTAVQHTRGLKFLLLSQRDVSVLAAEYAAVAAPSLLLDLAVVAVSWETMMLDPSQCLLLLLPLQRRLL